MRRNTSSCVIGLFVLFSLLVQSAIALPQAPSAPKMGEESKETRGTANTVFWEQAEAAVEYYVEWSRDSSFEPKKGSGWIAGTQYEVKGLKLGITYYYRVKARDKKENESEYSNVVSSTQRGRGISGKIREWRSALSEKWAAGGPTMYFILLCWIIGLAKIIEKVSALRISKAFPRNEKVGFWHRFSFDKGYNEFIDKMRENWMSARVYAQGQDKKDTQVDPVETARNLCKENKKYPIARIFLTGLDNPKAPSDPIAGIASVEKEKLQSGLNTLWACSSIAPFLGLFGTVLGMIRAFAVYATEPDEALRAVKIGEAISLALVTTAFGLLVCISLLAVYYFLRARVDRIYSLWEEKTIEIAKPIQ